jgi:hypothetical protein
MALTRLKPTGVDTSATFTFANANVNTNANLGNLASANYFSGNGSLLIDITGANVTGYVPLANAANTATSATSATTAGTVTTAAQPNITSVGTLSSLSITGLTTATGGIKVSNIQDSTGTNTISVSHSTVEIVGNLTVGTGGTGNVSSNYFIGNGSTLTGIVASNITGQVANSLIAGTVYTNAQPNITSVGTLTNLSVSGAANVGTSTDGVVLAVGNSSSGADKFIEIQNTGGAFQIGTGTLEAFLYNLAATPVTIYTNETPYLRVTGTGETQVLSTTDATSKTTGALQVSGGVGITGNLYANYFIGNGSTLTDITGANVTGYVPLATAANTAGTVTTAAQPNITSVGTLSSLTVSGDATITGNLTVSGTYTYANVTSFNVKDPIIEQGGNPNGTPLSSNDGKDRGQILHYYSSGAIDAFMGWDNSNSEFGFGSNVSVSSEVVTWNSYGNIRAGYFIGNGSTLTNITGANVTGYVPLATAANTATSATSATTAGTVTTAAQPNITSVGTLTSLTASGLITATSGGIKVGNLQDPSGTNTIQLLNSNVSVTGNIVAGAGGSGNVTATYFIGDGSQLTGVGGTYSNTNVAAYLPTYTGNFTAGNANITSTVSLGSGSGGSITGANLVSANYFTGTLTTAAQPNITSVGTLSGLTVTGNTTSGNIKTDNLLYANGVAWSFGSTYSNTNVAAYLPTYTGNVNAGNVLTNNLLYANGVAWTLGGGTPGGSNTQVQFNDGGSFNGSSGLTFDKTTTRLTANNFTATSTANLGSNANITITGGSSGQYLKTDGAGNLSWSTVSSTTVNYYSRNYYWAGPVTVNTGTTRLYLPLNSTLVNAYFNLATAGTSNTVIATEKNGSVIGTTTLGSNVSNTTTSFSTSMSVNDYLTVDVTTAGASAVDLYITYVFTTT